MNEDIRAVLAIDAEARRLVAAEYEERIRDLEAQLCWRACSEAMPADDAPVEFIARLDHRVLATGRHTKVFAIPDLIWWADDGTLWADRFVTHWRPWFGWPGEEEGKG